MGKNAEISILTMFTPNPGPKKANFGKKEKKPPTQVPHRFQKHKNSKSETFRGSYTQPRSMGKNTEISIFTMFTPLPWAQKEILEK